MTTKFFTNEKENTLLEKFQGVFTENPQIAQFDALVAYFYATGYFKLRPSLAKLSQIRILIGIDVDQITQQAQQAGLALDFGADPDQVAKDYIKKLAEEISNADYQKDLEQSVEQFIEDINTKKIILKAHAAKKIHAKIYIMRPQQFTPHSTGEVITGSSNLSLAGLGSGDDKNYEFNVLLRDYDDVKFATDEFEKLWQEAIDILPATLKKAKEQTHLRDVSSFELYIKLLIEYYGSEVDFDPNSIGDLPAGFKRLQYQMDAVEQGYQLLEKHNGFFLSDVVGLGKTVIAILIAQRFFHCNNYPAYRSHILIVCPPAVKGNWQETIKKFRLDNVAIITNGSLSKIMDDNDEREKYDLIIVDESHAFRNANSNRYQDLQIICKTKCRDGSAKRVILVSATPMNNGPADLKNQLLLFQDSNASTLAVHVESYFQKILKQYQELLNQGGADKNKKIDDLIEDVRLKIIEQVTVRRTRTDLTKHASYKQDLAQQGIIFPKVQPLTPILYQLEPELNALYDQSVQIIAGKLADKNNVFEYAPYRVIEFLKPQHKKDYKRADFIVQQLSGFMKTLLLKRLDSSFIAFNASLETFVQTTDRLIKRFENNRIYLTPNIDIDKYLETDREEELLEELMTARATDPSIKILSADDFEEDFLPLLKKDRDVLLALQKRWQQVVGNKPDPKLNVLKQQLADSIMDNMRNPDGQCVIFSESAVTTEHLRSELQKDYKVLAISSKNRQALQNTIRENFDANYDREKQKSNYNIIIATETLAEGINLHRANSVVNYDTPWNSTRLMQRIGRINRIGSAHANIFIYNFFPTEKVESDIHLKDRAQKKLQAFHSALGEDSQIYSSDETVASFGLFDDTAREAEKITERFKYLEELRTFKRDCPDRFKQIKNLPLKMRNAVNDQTNSSEKNHKNPISTVCFLRNDRHNVFYRTKDDTIEDIGFFTAVEYFKCHKSQNNVTLPDIHYQQIAKCLKEFSSHDAQKKAKEQNPMLSPPKNQAINYLKALTADASICPQAEKYRLNQAIEWIRIGRYQSFHKDINKIEKNSRQRMQLSLAKQLETVIASIDRYSKKAHETPQAEAPKDYTSKPDIVISQTYV